MLENLLVSFLILSQANPTTTQQYSQAQNPQIYTQTSEDDLSKRLLEEADSRAKKNPVSAIPFYRRVIIENGTLKEEAIKKVGSIYKDLAFREEASKSAIEIALNFYNEVIERHSNSSYLSKAYLLSGVLIWQSSMADADLDILKVVFERSEARLKQAYKIGGNEIKSDAAWNLALMYRNYSSALLGTDPSSPVLTAKMRMLLLIQSKKYVEEVIRLGGKHNEAAKDFLQYINEQTK